MGSPRRIEVATAEDVQRLEAKLDALAALLKPPAPEWVPVKEYAAKEKVSVRTVDRKIKAGILQSREGVRGREVRV